MNTPIRKQIDTVAATYGPPSTESIIALLFNQCHDTLNDEQLDYIQRSAAEALCTLNNVQRTLVNTASGIERDANMLADENAAAAFLYSLADHLASISKTLAVAEMAREEVTLRRLKATFQNQQGRAA